MSGIFSYHPAMSSSAELAIKGLLCLVALAVAVWRLRAERGSQRSRKRADRSLAVLALVAALAYDSFGLVFDHYFLHPSELFHYVLGSKYFPELGYDGLYVASIGAQLETDRDHPLPPLTRDLRTNRIVPTHEVADHEREVYARFAPERWAAFRADHSFFGHGERVRWPERMRMDHGYNPTPAWTFVARLFTAHLPVNATTLTLLTLIDPLLLAAAFFLLFRTYGLRIGSLALILFGLGYPWLSTWVGGAFLRQDWFAAVVIGTCTLKAGRPARAGALLAYAAAVRVFPLLLLFGLAVVALRCLVRREPAAWIPRFAAGFAAVTILAALAGTLTGRGASAWPEFFADIEKHRDTWSQNTAGLEVALLQSSFRAYGHLPAEAAGGAEWAAWQSEMTRAHDAARPFTLAATALILLLVAAAAWDARHDEALVLGVAVVFALLVLSSYYWALLCVVPIQRRWTPTLGLLLLNATLFGMAWSGCGYDSIHVALSWGLLAIVLAWLFPLAVRKVSKSTA